MYITADNFVYGHRYETINFDGSVLTLENFGPLALTEPNKLLSVSNKGTQITFTVNTAGNLVGNWSGGIITPNTGTFTATKEATPATLATRFVDKNNGTIYDSASNLTWLKNADCFGLQNYDAALASASTLTSGGGKCALSDGSKAGDWRVPTVSELLLFSDDGFFTSVLNKDGFSNVQSAYWSGDSDAFNAENAWFADISGIFDLHADVLPKSTTRHVWLVRTGQ